MLSMFDSREEFLPFHLDLPTLSCTVYVEGVVVFVLYHFLFVESEVTYKEFPPTVVSPWTYF